MDEIYRIELPSPPPTPSFGVRVIHKIKRMVSKPAPSGVAKGWPAMPYPTAELIYWRPAQGVNFGDELSRTVVELMLARRGFTIFDQVDVPKSMLAIGSVVHFASDDNVVWGSGVNGSIAERSHRYKSLDVRAVRGPITRQFLTSRGIDVPRIYGDPGLLINILTEKRFANVNRTKVGIIPHMSEMARDELARYENSEEFRVIDPREGWNRVVEEIASCKTVIAGSLHGLIVADAFGIPSTYVRLGTREGLLKYEDYYAGTGRALKFATSFEEALKGHTIAGLPQFDADALIGAFPYDIWERGKVQI